MSLEISLKMSGLSIGQVLIFKLIEFSSRCGLMIDEERCVPVAINCTLLAKDLVFGATS